MLVSRNVFISHDLDDHLTIKAFAAKEIFRLSSALMAITPRRELNRSQGGKQDIRGQEEDRSREYGEDQSPIMTAAMVRGPSHRAP